MSSLRTTTRAKAIIVAVLAVAVGLISALRPYFFGSTVATSDRVCACATDDVLDCTGEDIAYEDVAMCAGEDIAYDDVLGCVATGVNSDDVAMCAAQKSGDGMGCIKDGPIKKIVDFLFPWANKAAETSSNFVEREVFVGGTALGFTLNCEGVVIVGLSDVITARGAISPTQSSDIAAGDVLKQIDGVTIKGADMIESLVNDKTRCGRPIKVKVVRRGQAFETTIHPALDAATGKYKLGLWIRDNAAGVGTLTYIRKDNGRFGALGHPVCDIDTGALLPIDDGAIYGCNIVGVARGERGKPGELRGLFLKGGDQIGVLDNNTNFGVFGSLQKEALPKVAGETMLTAPRESVKIGRATVRCTVDGTTPENFDIEIIKTNTFSSSAQKNMVIRITDPRLLSATGGIVQGMSGSPIIQNGKLVGAVTHVFVSDPTKGFATFIDNMIES